MPSASASPCLRVPTAWALPWPPSSSRRRAVSNRRFSWSVRSAPRGGRGGSSFVGRQGSPTLGRSTPDPMSFGDVVSETTSPMASTTAVAHVSCPRTTDCGVYACRRGRRPPPRDPLPCVLFPLGVGSCIDAGAETPIYPRASNTPRRVGLDMFASRPFPVPYSMPSFVFSYALGPIPQTGCGSLPRRARPYHDLHLPAAAVPSAG